MGAELMFSFMKENNKKQFSCYLFKLVKNKFLFFDLGNVFKCLDIMFSSYSLLNMKSTWLYHFTLISLWVATFPIT